MNSNFPPGKPDPEIVILGQESEDTAENWGERTRRFYTFRHPFIMKLIECGVLPAQCADFRIDCPVDGVLSITATYYIERESFDRAIRETYSEENQAQATAFTEQNEEHAKKRATRIKRR
jgi:hypothetical protein